MIMDFNKRIEFTCGKCGKTRILSPKEASEDGWRINSENGKIECYQCLPKYGIPTTFLRVPKDVYPTIDDDGVRGLRFEF